VFVLVQLIRIFTGKGCAFSYPGAQHALLLVVCLMRWLECMNFSGNFGNNVPDIFTAITTAIPYMVLFWAYTLLIAQWAGTHHFAMSTGGKGFDILRLPFIIANLVVAAGCLAIIVSLAAVTSNSDRDVVAQAGSYIMAVIMLAVAVGFCTYGGLLFNSLRKAPTKTLHPEGGNCFKVFNQLGELPKRLFIVTFFFSLSFLGEAICWIISAATPNFAGRGSDIVTGFYLAFDCICILTLIYLFYKTVNEYVKPSKTEKPVGGSVGAGGSTGSHSGHDSKGKTLKPSERRAAEAKKSSTPVERTTNGQTLATERSDVVAGAESQFTGSNVSRAEIEMQSVVGDIKEEDITVDSPKVPETPTSGEKPLLMKTNQGSSMPDQVMTPMTPIQPIMIQPVASTEVNAPSVPLIVQPVSPVNSPAEVPVSPTNADNGSAPLIVDPVSSSSQV